MDYTRFSSDDYKRYLQDHEIEAALTPIRRIQKDQFPETTYEMIKEAAISLDLLISRRKTELTLKQKVWKKLFNPLPLDHRPSSAQPRSEENMPCHPQSPVEQSQETVDTSEDL